MSQGTVSCNSRTCHRSRTHPPSNSSAGRTKRTKKRPGVDLLASMPSLAPADFEEENLPMAVETPPRSARLNSAAIFDENNPCKCAMEFRFLVHSNSVTIYIQRLSSDGSIVQVMNLTGDSLCLTNCKATNTSRVLSLV